MAQTKHIKYFYPIEFYLHKFRDMELSIQMVNSGEKRQ